MAAMNRWDAEDYKWQMEAVGTLYEACRQRSIRMQNALYADFTAGDRNYDPTGAIESAVGQFAAATARLNNLLESMKAYEQEYTAMVEQGQSSMENVAVNNTVYGTFGALVAGGTALSSLCAGSVAWQFSQSGFDFNTHFNDISTFVDNTNYEFFEAMQALGQIGNWDSLTVDLLWNGQGGGTTDFSEGLLSGALISSLESVPGYTTDMEEVDWGWLGDKLGVPGLGKDVEKIIKWISSLEGTIDYEKMSDELTDIMFRDGAGTAEMAAVFQSFMRADKLGALMGKLTKMGFSAGKAVETILEMYYHVMANHVQQVEYLDSIDEAMAMAGYSEVGGLRGTLREIRESFVNQETYFLDRFYNEAEEVLKDKLGDAITEGANVVGQIFIDAFCADMPSLAGAAADVTPLKYANVILDGISTAVNLAGKDQIEAVETLQGLQMYTPTLIRSFENCMEIISSGVANAEDVANAENLFQLIRASKMKEYEAMLTLQSQGEVANQLREKYALLERMGSLEDFVTIPESYMPK